MYVQYMHSVALVEEDCFLITDVYHKMLGLPSGILGSCGKGPGGEAIVTS